MGRVAIVTDTNSGIMRAEANEKDVFLLPMPFIINEESYLEGIDLTHEVFYEKMEAGAEVSTSQPSPGDLLDLWDNILEEYDEIVHIPMSSALSKSYETAQMLSRDYKGRVQVVDNRRIAVTMRHSVLDAKELANKGYSALQIREILEKEGGNSSIYITVDTLKYLKKGGRVTSAGAAIGTVLNIKPVLEIQGGKLDAKAKARGMKSARKIMIKSIQEDLDARFAEDAKLGRVHLDIAHTKVDSETLESWIAEVEAAFPSYEIHVDPLALSIACHIGPGALALTAACYPQEL